MTDINLMLKTVIDAALEKLLNSLRILAGTRKEDVERTTVDPVLGFEQPSSSSIEVKTSRKAHRTNSAGTDSVNTDLWRGLHP